MRVIVIGGGIGGLTLAAGLRRRGTEVEVIERDTDLAATAGYHLHLDGGALAGLATALGPAHLERVYAAASAGWRQGPDVVRDMRGRLLAESRVRDEADSVNIDRIALRLVLADAAGDALTTGRSCTGFERDDDGTVRVRLDDGSSRTADLLVGADGIGSVVATTLAGGPTSAPLGLVGVGGRTCASALPDDVGGLLAARSGLAVGPRGTGLYIGYHDPVGQSALWSISSDGRTSGPTYIWGAIAPESVLDRSVLRAGGAELRDLTAGLLHGLGWSERLLTVLDRCDVGSVDGFRLHASAPDPCRLAPWASGTVTALGDAVHAMPPTAGMGAVTAIGDAARLLAALDDVAAGRATVPVAVHGFEVDMRARGARAVTASLGPIGWLRRADSAVGAAAARVALPALAAMGAVGRRRFSPGGR